MDMGYLYINVEFWKLRAILKRKLIISLCCVDLKFCGMQQICWNIISSANDDPIWIIYYDVIIYNYDGQ